MRYRAEEKDIVEPVSDTRNDPSLVGQTHFRPWDLEIHPQFGLVPAASFQRESDMGHSRTAVNDARPYW